MKTKITLKLDVDLVREARVLAAEAGTSISAMLAEKLKAAFNERKGYDRARKRALSRLKNDFELRWERPCSRDELHER